MNPTPPLPGPDPKHCCTASTYSQYTQPHPAQCRHTSTHSTHSRILLNVATRALLDNGQQLARADLHVAYDAVHDSIEQPARSTQLATCECKTVDTLYTKSLPFPPFLGCCGKSQSTRVRQTRHSHTATPCILHPAFSFAAVHHLVVVTSCA
jgi:hypothetical protein